jgi:hypothetical protein
MHLLIHSKYYVTDIEAGYESNEENNRMVAIFYWRAGEFTARQE